MTSSIRFHDAHAHAIEAQVGGFLIAVEGKPFYPGTLTNEQVLSLADPARRLVAVPYARMFEPDSKLPSAVIKYHPRREGYGPAWVAADIEKFGRKIVLIDTLNAIDWPPRFYLDLALRFPAVQFVMCHSGGYDIIEFIKMARFVGNVWIDFSATQEIFGWADGKPNLFYVCDAIDHAFGESRIARKLMFGADGPAFNQAKAVARLVEKIADPEPFLIGNFEKLIEILHD